ncbi:hypothetical protein CS533_01460 [Yersinia bercovieri]|uniref:Uncharacterized protein n=1 Tax=Yersinia bercovieri TaxID=634 RepID=A0A2G4U9Q4_YERBE|nr:hypothetical protein CS533_01460 [Yersinia bercovieri]
MIIQGALSALKLLANTPAAARKKNFPKPLESQVGSKQTHPDELTQVSDSGKCAQLTPLRLPGKKFPKAIGVAGRQQANASR